MFLLTEGIIAKIQEKSKSDRAYGINPVVHSLIVDGVCAGVGSVLSFLPTIVVLFFFLCFVGFLCLLLDFGLLGFVGVLSASNVLICGVISG